MGAYPEACSTHEPTSVGEMLTEARPGADETPATARRVLSDPSASMIIVTYRDRPARHGTEHPIAALTTQSRRIVAGDHDHNHDPVRTVTATTQGIPEPEVR